MGKATIVGGGADGLYTIEIDAGAQQQADRVARVEQELATVAARIAEAEAEYLETTTRETYAAGALNAAIESYAAAVQANPLTASSKEVDRLTGEYYDAARRAGQARTRLQNLTLQQRQLQADKAILASAPAGETRDAWCADLTEDAAGEVATIEVPGEPGTVLVAPGGRAPSAGDGALLARELMTPEQAFFNAAILPGWQKWKPTFRTGTITAINDGNDTADVSLDAATSSAQGLGVNQTSRLSGVPVEYMECNAAAFEVGDACVVRFDGQSWDAPKVVGFVREPKPCLPEFIYVPIKRVTKFVSNPIFTGRYCHNTVSWFDEEDIWFSYEWHYVGDDVFEDRQINEAIVKNSYVCMMSEASAKIDGDDVDVFGASIYPAISLGSVIKTSEAAYIRPLGTNGFFKTLNVVREFSPTINRFTNRLYIKTARNMMEYQGAIIRYAFIVPGTDAEEWNVEYISGSVVNAGDGQSYAGGTGVDKTVKNKFELEFPGGAVIADEFIGNISTGQETDATLRQVFSAPNTIKSISKSGARYTYHLHKYATSGNNFQVIYKRGAAPT